MSFIEELKETCDSWKSFGGIDQEFCYRGFKHFLFDDVRLSIQASYGHYCTPRKTLRDVSKYTTMEFALIRDDGEFIRVSDVLPDFSRLEESEEYWGTVYGFVPVDLIEALFQELKKKANAGAK